MSTYINIVKFTVKSCKNKHHITIKSTFAKK